ncbi:MAG: C69 family dipeptidase [Candidatus Heimdallarchaeota archaeon]|nr:C69 family dipeptidase [Candidatus Heimdallarchaeota archaeon]
MCDTMVALGNSTKSGKVLFAKNSDRQPDEPAEIVYFSRTTHPKNSIVKTTYIEIPQVSETAAILLCKPIWIWGAEMGTNEYGVTIGNEAVYTKEKYIIKGSLLGMDLLRLGLERSKTAKEALVVIVDLLELYGQGGNHGYRKKLFYHNSYLIADKTEAWVLETAGKYWIAEQVKDIRTISNTITIRGSGDIHHPELIEHAIEKNWCKNEDEFDFFKHYRHKTKLEQIFAFGIKRCKLSSSFLEKEKGQIDEKTMMKILRYHYPEKSSWNPNSDASLKSICVHAKNIFNPSQSTVSMVSELNDNIQLHWITGTSAPCTSIFKPFFLPDSVPKLANRTTATYNPDNLWWQHEKLHRLTLLDYTNRLSTYKFARDKMEDSFIFSAKELVKENESKIRENKDKITDLLQNFTKMKLAESQKAENEWIESIVNRTIKKRTSYQYRKFWEKRNKRNKLLN